MKVIFRQEGPLSSGNHYGCRIVQGRDGNLWLTMGDHFSQRDEAQNLANHIGKIVRVTPDGAVPPDNPFVNRKDAKPESGVTATATRKAPRCIRRPANSGMHEHGPRGGDEINIPLAGKNYGWPVIGYGVDYSGAKIHEATEKAGMEQPIKYWVPSIAPSGMAFYTGYMFPAWKATCSSARSPDRCWCGSSSTARRSARKSGCSPICASASATCGRDRTARSGCSPTAATASCCASRRRNDRHQQKSCDKPALAA